MSDVSKIVMFTVLADNINTELKTFNLNKDDTIVVKVGENSTAADMHDFHNAFREISAAKNKVLVILQDLDLENWSKHRLEMLKNTIDELLEGES